jgi:hypothetical protein
MLMLNSRRKAPVVFGRQIAMKVARLAAKADMFDLVQGLEELVLGLPRFGPGSTWYIWGNKVLSFLRGESAPPLKVFKKDGNSKLPFYTWSTVPIYTCPGKGQCASWCYSLRAWRYAAPFWRQVQNTIMIRFFPEMIADLFVGLPQNITFRLYVDGDFDSEGTVRFWFRLLRLRPDIESYGYSKSWDEIYSARDAFPENYVLNVSSGGKVRSIDQATIESLSITRGKFLAVSVDKRFIDMKTEDRYASAEYHKAVRESAKALGHQRVFSCPGKCGECVAKKDGTNEHACGQSKSGRFGLMVIANGIH